MSFEISHTEIILIRSIAIHSMHFAYSERRRNTRQLALVLLMHLKRHYEMMNDTLHFMSWHLHKP